MTQIASPFSTRMAHSSAFIDREPSLAVEEETGVDPPLGGRHHGRAAGEFAQRGELAAPLGLGQQVGLVEHHQVGGARIAGPARLGSVDHLDQAAGAALVALLAQMALGNMLTSAAGMVFWLLFGLLARPRFDADADADGGEAAAAVPALVSGRA